MGDGPAFARACMHLYCSLQSVRLHTTMYGQHSRFRMQGSSDYLLIHVRFNIILATPARAKRDQIRNKDVEVEDLNTTTE